MSCLLRGKERESDGLRCGSVRPMNRLVRESAGFLDAGAIFTFSIQAIFSSDAKERIRAGHRRRGFAAGVPRRLYRARCVRAVAVRHNCGAAGAGAALAVTEGHRSISAAASEDGALPFLALNAGAGAGAGAGAAIPSVPAGQGSCARRGKGAGGYGARNRICARPPADDPRHRMARAPLAAAPRNPPRPAIAACEAAWGRGVSSRWARPCTADGAIAASWKIASRILMRRP